MNGNPTIIQHSIHHSDKGLSLAPVPFKIGDALLGLYQVKDIIHTGGMGQVFRVHHSGWNIDLALKQPRKEQFMIKKQKDAFKAECEHWMDLGLHKNITTCFYVREIEGIPSIFAEWMDGSLADLIYSGEDNGKPGKLYEGSEDEALKRILDIAIQIARGLHYAHNFDPRKVLIHQDIKPSNLLINIDDNSKALTAKVADFGIANARAIIDDDCSNAPVFFSGCKSVVSHGSAHTPSYCSPEQARRKKLTIKTDIWSFSVTILEMLLCNRPWDNPYIKSGVAAGIFCDYYFEKAKIPIPKAMKDLLRWCFQINEADRPKDFGVVETELLKIYRAHTGQVYPHPEPKAASLAADSLNNRALSYVDMGNPEKAEENWTEALKKDRNHCESVYNRCVYLLQNKRISDTEALKALQEISSEKVNYYNALLYLAWGNVNAALEQLEQAKQKMGDTDEIRKAENKARNLMDNDTCFKFKRAITKNEDNKSAITSICVSSDGKWILTGTEFTSVHLWNASTGRHLRKFPGITKRVNTVVLSLDMKLIAGVGLDRIVNVWDVESGERLKVFNELHADYNTLCFSPDSKLLIGACNDGVLNRDNYIFIWDKDEDEDKVIRLKSGENDPICAIAARDNQTFVTLTKHGKIQTWDVSSKKCVSTTIEFHSKEWKKDSKVSCARFNSDITAIITYDCPKMESRVSLWDARDGHYIRCFTNNLLFGCEINFSPDCELIVMRDGNIIKLWNVSTGKCIFSYEETSGTLPVCFAFDGKTIISGHVDGLLREWKIPERIPYEFEINSIHTSDLASAEQTLFYNLKRQFDMFMYEKDIARALDVLKKMTDIPIFDKSEKCRSAKLMAAPYCVKGDIIRFEMKNVIPFNNGDLFLPARDFNNAIIVSKIDANITLLDLETCNEISKKNFNDFFWGAIIISAKISADGRKVVAGTATNKFIVWDAMKETVMWFTTKNSHLFVENIRSDGEGAILQSIDNKGKNKTITYIVDQKKQQILYAYSIDKKYCFSPDYKTYLQLDGNKIIQFNSETNIIKYVYLGHVNYVRWADFSADGKYILSYDNDDYVINLWNTETGKFLHTLDKISPPHGDNSFQIFFCAENAKIIAYSIFNRKLTVWVWETITGKLDSVLEFEKEKVNSVNINSDGTMAIVNVEDNILWAWNLKNKKSKPLELFIDDSHIEKVYFSSDGWRILVVGLEKAVLYDLDYDLTFPGWDDKVDGVQRYVEIFLKRYPHWTDEDISNILIPDLQNRGYGRLKLEEVRGQLEEITKKAVYQRRERSSIR